MRLALLPLFPLLMAWMAHAASDSVMLVDFENGIPKNKAGNPYVSQYEGESGKAAISLIKGGGFDGGACAQFEVTQGGLYAQFNAHNADGSRGFAREYVRRPADWKFDTYNRLGFWIKNPVNGGEMSRDGNAGLQVGTYMKRVKGADTHSDEAGGGHWYHLINLPNTNTWIHVIINPHPHHFRGANGNFEEKNQPHPTGEAGYNYFDALTRFYVNVPYVKAGPAPIVYQLDDFGFYREPYPENDDQIYGLAGTYVPAEGKFILTWSRDKDQNKIRHEVRYSDRNIHEIGWEAAKPAPAGLINPAGDQGYNGMYYVMVLKKAAGPIYFAIKPQNSKLFSQIMIPVPQG